MPEFEPFTALGRGNGFTYCPEEIDVSSADWWITLGGTEKGNPPTQAELDLSLRNAMKLYWLTYSLTGSARADNGAGTNRAVSSQEIENGSRVFNWYRETMAGSTSGTDDDSQTALEPKDRVCDTGTPSGTPGSSSDIGTTAWQQEHQYTFEGTATALNARITMLPRKIVRMMDGGNFVGYGVECYFEGEDFSGSPSVIGEDPFEGDVGSETENGPFEACGRVEDGGDEFQLRKHTFLSYLPDEDYYDNFTGTTRTITYSSIGGFPMIEVVYEYSTGSTVVEAEVSSLDFYENP